MYTTEEYNKLVIKYGPYASWAIWDYKDENEVSIIDKNVSALNSRYVLLGLNISGTLKEIPWCNFHGGKHDRKIKYACNDTCLRGAYITDLFKDVSESDSAKIEKHLTPETITKNITFLEEEMNDVKADNKSKFIVLGKKASFYFESYFKQKITSNISYYPHYSSTQQTDKDWVLGLWKMLGIKEDIDLMLKKYNK